MRRHSHESHTSDINDPPSKKAGKCTSLRVKLDLLGGAHKFDYRATNDLWWYYVPTACSIFVGRYLKPAMCSSASFYESFFLPDTRARSGVCLKPGLIYTGQKARPQHNNTSGACGSYRHKRISVVESIHPTYVTYGQTSTFSIRSHVLAVYY